MVSELHCMRIKRLACGSELRYDAMDYMCLVHAMIVWIELCGAPIKPMCITLCIKPIVDGACDEYY